MSDPIECANCGYPEMDVIEYGAGGVPVGYICPDCHDEVWPGEPDKREEYVAWRVQEHERAGITSYNVADFYEEYDTRDLYDGGPLESEADP